MFNIGPLELMVILLVALLVVGPARLPDIGRTVGKSLREFRRASDQVRRSLELDLENKDERRPPLFDLDDLDDQEPAARKPRPGAPAEGE